MTSQTPERLVLEFFAGLAQQRVDQALESVDDDIRYTNVSLPTIRGKRRFGAVMRRLNSDRIGFDAEILAITANADGVVLTERRDELRIGPLRMQFWVCGRNEVRDGRITVWRDYFDYGNCAVGLLRGLVGLVIPAAVPPLSSPVSALAPTAG